MIAIETDNLHVEKEIELVNIDSNKKLVFIKFLLFFDREFYT